MEPACSPENSVTEEKCRQSGTASSTDPPLFQKQPHPPTGALVRSVE
jgi:hypothetical protein